MAVGAARGIATRLVKIQKLSSLYHQEVAEFRVDAIKATAGNLWRRYNEEKRRVLRREEKMPPFLDWLVSVKQMERTFWHVKGGMSLPTRRKWAIGYYKFLTRKELTLADDPSNLWVFDALETALNAKHNDPDWIIVVETVTREAIPRYRLDEGVSFMFGKIERPAPEVEAE